MPTAETSISLTIGKIMTDSNIILVALAAYIIAALVIWAVGHLFRYPQVWAQAFGYSICWAILAFMFYLGVILSLSPIASGMMEFFVFIPGLTFLVRWLPEIDGSVSRCSW